MRFIFFLVILIGCLFSCKTNYYHADNLKYIDNLRIKRDGYIFHLDKEYLKINFSNKNFKNEREKSLFDSIFQSKNVILDLDLMDKISFSNSENFFLLCLSYDFLENCLRNKKLNIYKESCIEEILVVRIVRKIKNKKLYLEVRELNGKLVYNFWYLNLRIFWRNNEWKNYSDFK